MKISIVMSSFDRVELLKLGLSSLWEQASKNNAEIVIVNDGMEHDGTEEVCKSYRDKINIKYVFSGHRNRGVRRSPEAAISTASTLILPRRRTQIIEVPIPRNPCKPNNIAFKQSTGDVVFFTCPEMYHLKDNLSEAVEKLKTDKKAMVVPDTLHMDNGKFLKCLQETPELATFEFLTNNVSGLKKEGEMPFFLGLWREEFEKIGGYDEDFAKGYACEDNDLVERLIRQGLHYEKMKMDIVHLFHGREGSVSFGSVPKHLRRQYNMNFLLLRSRKRYNIRNPRGWGRL